MSAGQDQVDATNEHLQQETNLVKSIANLEKKHIKWMEVEHGDTDKGDYVLHFTDHHAQRTFPKSPKLRQQIVNSITFNLDKVVPEAIVKDFQDSPEGWEKVVYTIFLRKFNSESFNFDDDRMAEALVTIGEEVSAIIEGSHVRREF